MKKLLPLGSVVLLETGVQKLMILGRFQIDTENDEQYSELLKKRSEMRRISE